MSATCEPAENVATIGRDYEDPELTAWRCGRLVNQIEHRTQARYLCWGRASTESPDEEGSIGEIPWHDLRLAVRGLVSDERDRRLLEAAVADAAQDWCAAYGSRWHHESIYEQTIDIVDDFNSSECDCDFVSFLARHFDDLLSRGGVTEIIRRLKTMMEAASNSRQLEIYLLARHVDRLIHPVPAYWAMHVDVDLPAPSGGLSWQGPPPSPSSRSPRSTFPEPPVLRLPQLPMRVLEILPEWGPEFQLRVAQLGLQDVDASGYSWAACPHERRVLVAAIEDHILSQLRGASFSWAVNSTSTLIVDRPLARGPEHPSGSAVLPPEDTQTPGQSPAGRVAPEAETPSTRDDQPRLNPQPVRREPQVPDGPPVAESSRVKLYANRTAVIDGQPVERLRVTQYDVIKTLIDAGDEGLSKDDLEQDSRHPDARGILTRLRKKDDRWRQVIQMPGKSWRGYRIS